MDQGAEDAAEEIGVKGESQKIKEEYMSEILTKELKTNLEIFNTKHEFVPGQIVRWKPRMKNKRAEGPFIVVDVLPSPIISQDDESGSQYFQEPLDLLLGYTHPDQEFTIHHYDSRRMEPAE